MRLLLQPLSFFFLLLLQLRMTVQQPTQADTIAAVFDPNVLDGYQRKYKIEVPPKQEDCFFIEDVRVTQKLHFHYMVVNVGQTGQRLDISTKINGPDGKIVNYQSRKTEGSVIGHEVTFPGDYKICFNNRFSLFESKRVFWQFEIEGAPDEMRSFQQGVNSSLGEYVETSVQVKRTANMVRGKVNRMRNMQWRVEQNMVRDTARAEAIMQMVDRWSIVHMTVVVVIGIVQVILLRRFFNMKPSSNRMNART